MQEVWKPYIYNYEVSNLGRIRNIKTNRILKTSVNSRGYESILLSLGSKGNIRCIVMHRVIAQLFLPNPDNLPVINHIDGNKLNNKLENLEWCTYLENSRHALEAGLFNPPTGTRNGSSKLTEEDVIFARENYKPRDKECGANALARKFGVSKTTMLSALKGNTWAHLPNKID